MGIKYNGNNVFKNVYFGLYGFEDIQFEESKESIKEAFEGEYLDEITKRLNAIGITFMELSYYSPQSYNYANDALDLTIKVIDKTVLRKAIVANVEKIQTELDKNKSYDGYLATTVNRVEDELELMPSEDYEPDMIVLRELLDLDCDEFDIDEYLVFEAE